MIECNLSQFMNLYKTGSLLFFFFLDHRLLVILCGRVRLVLYFTGHDDMPYANGWVLAKHLATVEAAFGPRFSMRVEDIPLKDRFDAKLISLGRPWVIQACSFKLVRC